VGGKKRRSRGTSDPEYRPGRQGREDFRFLEEPSLSLGFAGPVGGQGGFGTWRVFATHRGRAGILRKKKKKKKTEGIARTCFQTVDPSEKKGSYKGRKMEKNRG